MYNLSEVARILPREVRGIVTDFGPYHRHTARERVWGEGVLRTSSVKYKDVGAETTSIL